MLTDSGTIKSKAKALGVKPNTVVCRLRRGWTEAQAYELEPPPVRKMPTRTRDVTGERFGRLVVTKVIRDRRVKVVCICDCGCEKTVLRQSLLAGLTKSCGCLIRDNEIERGRVSGAYGKSRTKLYVIWAGMKRRCCNPDDQAYDQYGGRGITVAESWVNNFQQFEQDMGDPPTPLHTLDRRNNDKGYSKQNCRWATKKEQARNRRTNRHLVVNGEKKTLAEWCEVYDADPALVGSRVRKFGWEPLRALTEPAGRGRRRAQA